MRTLIFRTIAPALTSLMLLFSVFVLLRGHNDPGGGFIGGLIAVAAIAIYGIAFGVPSVRRALYFHPLAISGAGLLLAAASGLLSFVQGVPFLTGIWASFYFLGAEIDVSTVMSFDIGVYLVVLGSLSSVALALEDREDG
ncbi:Na(+)/H(+) antiporter subunit B [Mesorhizobium sp. BAC0120]|uniref:Na(+)/H(+) antiporter subunit B n=1 Tax=Mesorhizobium sp. BAC0120 TaxID=3090670 RepID=UPI00298D5DE7|nr:Na(+)/H(+) antiporter subunit B [Mesorhizobium sp. BAC0120]MDW6021062.1 Na(+)/H(+) antiporter subunit B [Mesorhizobium sp. BAC0120]